MAQHRLKEFIDIEFIANNDSVYYHINQEKHLDQIIHWRRPSQFIDSGSTQDINKL